MKPSPISLDLVTALPCVYRQTIPESYRDENGHMNVRWYLHVFDDAGYPFVAGLGLTPEFHQQRGTGGFDLEHHLHYLSEVLPGDNVAVYVRVVGRTAKRVHYLMFMVNESRLTLAAIFECVNSFADLKLRRTAPFPDEIAGRLDELIAVHQALDWPAPTCGVMRS